ncbi:hypothetical protein N7449_007189 [Penicillium cf. viridicatum]|uniref:Uncharacterized protein n=1 Tax=Penicillium cf. viridicatum TaxID=2972119 RepID=A0A9W9JKR3_9EURO|nr:hypothetical protein N7449_007189 [Penicillium cf. viridicatum]
MVNQVHPWKINMSWQTYPAVRLGSNTFTGEVRSIATGNDVEQSNSALWKFPQGPPGPFVSFRFHSIWETPYFVHLKVQDE